MLRGCRVTHIVRIRPEAPQEAPLPKLVSAVHAVDGMCTVVEIPPAPSQRGKRQVPFDRVLDQSAGQEAAFNAVEPLVLSAAEGHNVSIFAYGQTNSGKVCAAHDAGGRPC